jgi:hypothetical protein
LARELDLLEGLEPEDGLLEPGARWSDRYDPRDDLVELIDCGWIGEDREGVWICRHPEAALAEDEPLWEPVERWRLGQRELTRDDLRELSAWQTEALIVMAAADQREQLRRVRSNRGTSTESRD